MGKVKKGVREALARLVKIDAAKPIAPAIAAPPPVFGGGVSSLGLDGAGAMAPPDPMAGLLNPLGGPSPMDMFGMAGAGGGGPLSPEMAMGSGPLAQPYMPPAPAAPPMFAAQAAMPPGIPADPSQQSGLQAIRALPGAADQGLVPPAMPWEPEPTVYAQKPLPGQLMPANADELTTFREGPGGGGNSIANLFRGLIPQESTPQEDIMRKMLIMQALGMATGNGATAAQIMPGAAAKAMMGQAGFEEQQRQIGLQQQEAQMAGQRQAAQIQHQQTADQLALRKQGADEQQAAQKYSLDLAQFNQKKELDAAGLETDRAKVAKDYYDLFKSMTPESAMNLYGSMDDEFKATYGIVLPEGGIEGRNPNAPTKEMLLQKDLDAAYRLLTRDPSRMPADRQIYVLQRIEDLRARLGIRGDEEDDTLQSLFLNIPPAESSRLRIALMNANTQRASQQDTAADRKARRELDRSKFNWQQQYERAGLNLRQNDLILRKWIAENKTPAGSKDPNAELHKMENFVQELVAQRTALTKGSFNPLNGQWIEPDPGLLQSQAGTIQWLDQSIQTWSAQANNLRQKMGLPPIGSAQLPQPAPAPAKAKPGTAPTKAKGAAAGKPAQATNAKDKEIATAVSSLTAIAAEMQRRNKQRGKK